VSDFHLVDLISQRDQVRAHLTGRSSDDIIRWLAARGQIATQRIGDREIFYFESSAGLQATFFFDKNVIVFVGDHTTFT
jgi:hypothetical protein